EGLGARRARRSGRDRLVAARRPLGAAARAQARRPAAALAAGRGGPRGHADAPGPLRHHRRAAHRAAGLALRLLHHRPLGPPDAPGRGLAGRRPPGHPRHPAARVHRQGGVARLPARPGGRRAAADAPRAARHAGLRHRL
ncbi:MAG: hypothetical protein AVDCRST_MAG65-2147, partial [uncultured Solirubrobacteraceae bacterium]